MEPKKLSEEILQTIDSLQQKSVGIVKELGEIEVGKIVLDSRRKFIEEALKEVNKEQDSLLREIEEKYGKGTIDISTGNFYPFEESTQAN